ncbi:tetratricopeptide repeat protein 34 [Pseudophryne corroboree]|uniref:tetratricopeptide repeat protein 34 n=1 Tax=Pseudophryne corroboree TaxID=495146 RepID=UPI00308218C2
MSGQDVPGRLCREAYEYLLQKQIRVSTAFYMAAFSCNAPIALQRVQSLDDGQYNEVINTLQEWCLVECDIPKIKCDGMAIVSLNPGIAAVFLSMLCPNNCAASLFKMGTFLKSGRYEEVVARCNSLLSAYPQFSLELLLTRGLAWILSRSHSANGVVDYIQVFTKQKEEAKQYICTKQREYLPQVINAFHDYVSSYENNNTQGNMQVLLHDCYSFLAALVPDDLQICKTQAAYLFEECKFEECIAVYSRAIKALSLETKIKEEKISCLLVDRAAAYYSLGCRTKEMVQDLAEAFTVSPGHARKRFTEIFSAADIARVMERSKSCIEMEFRDFREVVRARPELRSDTGAETLFPIIKALEFLIQCSAENNREMNVRLADCKLLAGDFRACLDICNQQINSDKKTYQNTLYVLRGFCYFHRNEHQEALKDFQKIIEDESPHPSSCVKALCGRGLVRMISGSSYLTALDYVTACKLKLDETFLTIKSYVPWNQRGLLYKVLQEEGEKMLHRKCSGTDENGILNRRNMSEQDRVSSKECDVSGVHQLGILLMMLDTTDDVCRILCTDALYQMDRIEEARKMLSLALNSSSQRSPVLARLALLQFKKGFIYDGNQLIKKVIQLGDTSCLLPIMDIFKEDDRRLMQNHCHSKALSILQSKQGDTYLKEAVAYLSFAIIASGGHAKDSLLTRARCYGQLGQKKTAIFDFNSVLKDEPSNVEALCGKGFTHMTLNQQKEAMCDIMLAIRTDSSYAVQEIRSLKPEAQLLVTNWLYDYCRTSLTQLLSANKTFQSDPTFKELELFAECLIEIDDTQAKVHIFYTDILIAKENYEEAFTHLKQSFNNSAIRRISERYFNRDDSNHKLRGKSSVIGIVGTNTKMYKNLIRWCEKQELGSKDTMGSGSMEGNCRWQKVKGSAVVSEAEVSIKEEQPSPTLNLDSCFAGSDIDYECRRLLMEQLQREAVFSKSEWDLGSAVGVEHHIRLTDDTPFRERLRRLVPDDFEDVRNHLQGLLENNTAGQEGSSFTQENKHEKALDYFSLAVIASHNNPKYLRQRAMCLSCLGDYQSAITDMDKAIQRHSANDLKTQVEDFCCKGQLLLSAPDEEAACRQYMKAVSLDSTLALAAISNAPGKLRLSEIFSHFAHKCFEQKLLEESWKLTECGLLINENNQELKRLKSKIKREASGCIVH